MKPCGTRMIEWLSLERTSPTAFRTVDIAVWLQLVRYQHVDRPYAVAHAVTVDCQLLRRDAVDKKTVAILRRRADKPLCEPRDRSLDETPSSDARVDDSYASHQQL